MPVPIGYQVYTVSEAAHCLGCSDRVVQTAIHRLRLLATQSRERGPWDVYLPTDSTGLQGLRATIVGDSKPASIALVAKEESAMSAVPETTNHDTSSVMQVPEDKEVVRLLRTSEQGIRDEIVLGTSGLTTSHLDDPPTVGSRSGCLPPDVDRTNNYRANPETVPDASADEAWLVLLRIYQRLDPIHVGAMAIQESVLVGLEQQIAERISALHDEVLRLGIAIKRLRELSSPYDR